MIAVEEVNNPCCICGQHDSTVLFETLFERWRYNRQFVMRKCCGCGLLFNSPRLPQEELKDHYNDDYYIFKRKDVDSIIRVIPIYLRTLRLIEKDVEEKTVLDIGSSKGYFPALLKRLGWEAEGVEISEKSARFGMEQFGVNAFVGTLDKYRMGGCREFSVITAIDVLEHVPDPAAFVNDLVGVCKSGNYVIIDTPNGRAYHIQHQKDQWRGFNPYHIYLFTCENLVHLLEERGCRIVHRFTYNNIYPTPADAKEPFPLKYPFWDLLHVPFFGRRLRRKDVHSLNVDEIFRLSAFTARRSKEFFDTPDAMGPLAKACEGENLVVIAQKCGD